MAQSQAAAHARGNRNYVLQCTAQFNPGEVVIHVNAEAGIAKVLLHARRQRAIGRGHGHGSWMLLRYFLGERWAANGAKLWFKPTEPSHHFMNDLSHAQKSVI